MSPLADERTNDNKQSQCNAAQTGSQTVDTVNQIDGIRDVYSKKDCQRHSDISRYLMQPQQSAQIINPQTEMCIRDRI